MVLRTRNITRFLSLSNCYVHPYWLHSTCWTLSTSCSVAVTLKPVLFWFPCVASVLSFHGKGWRAKADLACRIEDSLPPKMFGKIMWCWFGIEAISVNFWFSVYIHRYRNACKCRGVCACSTHIHQFFSLKVSGSNTPIAMGTLSPHILSSNDHSPLENLWGNLTNDGGERVGFTFVFLESLQRSNNRNTFLQI